MSTEMIILYVLTAFALSPYLVKIYKTDENEGLIKNRETIAIALISLISFAASLFIDFSGSISRLIVIVFLIITMRLSNKISGNSAIGGGDEKAFYGLFFAVPSPFLFIIMIFSSATIVVINRYVYGKLTDSVIEKRVILAPSIVFAYYFSIILYFIVV